ncbi:transmembrane signal receptor [Lithospermum erythrorhizon]|uniref:Transmembrane signal receptor n=1 Tax=Lithospermum erythrorhizon TaxID=34254 RepID=A0AAV3QKG1_LITER
MESRDAVFDENSFTTIPRPRDLLVDTRTRGHENVHSEHDSPSGETSQGHRIRYTYVSYYYNSNSDPVTFEEAMRSPDAPFWKEAIDDEMDSIMCNRFWKLASLPPGCKPVGCKWIFKKKMKADGIIDKFKARLVAKGYSQKEGIDYFDTYVPVARMTTIRGLDCPGLNA